MKLEREIEQDGKSVIRKVINLNGTSVHFYRTLFTQSVCRCVTENT